MCGIAGILDFADPPTRAQLAPMVGILRHRGPDADGFVVNGPLAMGMRRLAIIDLATGDQPIDNEDRSLTVVFNGEIYNYVELRRLLIRRGHRFRTTGDTEVLLHAYEELGADFLGQLNGMFAFAIWDSGRQRLLLARDRMGVKPLYYARVGGRLCFASELKALLQVNGLDRSLDLDALADYLRLGYIPREASPLRSVRRLLPGHMLLADRDGFSVRRWWRLEGAPIEDTASTDPAEVAELAAHFDDAVRLRMRSDVPVAAFLSGGLDSSLIAVTANRLAPRPVQTYTVGFDGALFDETPYATAVAEHGHTEHRQVTASADDALAMLPRLLWHMDEPLSDSAILPNYLVSRFAAERVKVCLSGLGGDELFGGYARYGAEVGRIRRLFQSTPRLAAAVAPSFARVRAAWADELTIAADASLAWRGYLHQLQVFDTPALRAMSFPARGAAVELIESLWGEYQGTDSVGRRQFIDQQTYLPDQILALTDRMSMAVSLEVRVPFMDFRLVQLAARIPGVRKQSPGDYKMCLKQALGDRVPPQILTRPKWGFDSPIARWVSAPAMRDLLRRLPQELSDLIDPRYVTALVDDPNTTAKYARQVWSLLVLCVWLRVHEAGAPPEMSLTDVLQHA